MEVSSGSLQVNLIIATWLSSILDITYIVFWIKKTSINKVDWKIDLNNNFTTVGGRRKPLELLGTIARLAKSPVNELKRDFYKNLVGLNCELWSFNKSDGFSPTHSY